MNSFKDISIKDFTYELPDVKIARYPLPDRDSSKLLVWKNGQIEEDIFRNVNGYLPENAQLIFNNTRVIHARLYFKKETGARIEIFCLEPIQPADYQIAFQQTQSVTWKCMIGNSKKWKSSELKTEFTIKGKKIELRAIRQDQSGNSAQVKFSWNGGMNFAEVIGNIGELPIPPYLKRATEEADEKTYQTVYARIDGSVAAPTAGLHFTDHTLAKLKQRNISTSEITLHVGAGTFQPVKSELLSGHTMHHEKVIIPRKIIERFIDNPKKIIAIGTTSVRSLESLYWLGLQLENSVKRKDGDHVGDLLTTNHDSSLQVLQWEPYENHASISVKQALLNILEYLEQNHLDYLEFSTQIIILPGYDFKIIEGMFTNFHQPQSTLLLLISAFLGEDWRKVYKYALDNEFRFLSYGDSNLYLK